GQTVGMRCLCGDIQLRRLQVVPLELGQTSRGRRQDKRIGERNHVARGLLSSSVDLFQLELEPTDICDVAGYARNLHSVPDSYSPPSHQHEVTNGGKNDTLKRNGNEI